LLDADVVDGSVRPFRGVSSVSSSHPRYRYQNGKGTRSLVELDGRWYWSDNDTGELGSTLGFFGVEPPQEKPGVVPTGKGNRFVGEYQYAITYETKEGRFESAAFPISADLTSFTTIVDTAREEVTVDFDADVEPFSATHRYRNDRHYGYEADALVRFNGRTYKCLQNWAFKSKFGPMSETPESAEDYWDDVSTETIKSVGVDLMELTIPQPSSNDIGRINIWRTVAGGGQLYEIGYVIPGEGSFSDTVPDSEAVLGRALSLIPAFPPVYQLSGEAYTKVGGKYLTVVDGVGYLAVGNKVYASEQNNLHAWNVQNFWIYDATVTAIIAEDRGVLVCTRNQTYHLVGSKPATATNRWIPEYQGCPNWRLASHVGNRPTWLSLDGICDFGYIPDINVERLTVRTEDKHSFDSPDSYRFAVVANDVFWLFGETGATCIDFRRQLVIYQRSVVAEFGWYDEEQDVLHVVNQGQVYQVDAGAVLEAEYVSPEILHPGVRSLKRVNFDSESGCSFEILVDGETKHTGSVTSAGYRKTRVAPGLSGSRFAIKVKTTGEVRAIEAEFTRI
jgi:hypothetical protein